MNNKRKKRLEHWQLMAIYVVICDFLSIHLSYFLALWLRFDGVYSHIPASYLHPYMRFITFYAVGCIILFSFAGLYRIMWRFASYEELVKTTVCSVAASLLHSILITLLCGRMPLSYHLWGAIFQLGCVIVPRFFYRFLLFMRSHRKPAATGGRVMVIGAGASGQMIIRDLKNSELLNDKAVVQLKT